MESRNKRIAKLLGLLLSSLMIGIASAYTYNMFMTSNVGVKASGMSFVANEDDFTICGGDIATDLQSVTFDTMDGLRGQPIAYVPVDIHCADTDGHNIELKLGTWNGGGHPDLNSITITMWSGAVQQGASIVLLPGGGSVTTTGSVPIANGETWNVEWIVDWKSTAEVGVDTVQVNLILVVAD